MKLKDCLPQIIPVDEELLKKSKEGNDGSRRLLIDYKNFIFCILIYSDSSVEMLFAYTASELYDDRFYRCLISGKFIKNTYNEGGIIQLELQKNED